MATNLLVIVLLRASFILVLSASGSSLTFTAVPQEITPGDTKQLSFTCQSEVSADDDLYSITIWKDDERMALLDVFGTSKAKLEDQIDGVTVKGSINDPEPNITLDWTSPPASAAGTYKCKTNSVVNGTHVNNEVEKVITLREQNTANDAKNDSDTNITCPPRQCYAELFEDLVNFLNKDQLKEVSKTSDWVEDLETDFQQMNDNKIRSQTAEMLWKDVMFKKSSPFNNKRYYLSRFQPTDAANAQSACESLGGYLAEIDDNSEYNFIRNFIDSGRPTGPIIPTMTILLGGTDETREGTWVYRRTGNPIGVRDWAPGQPDNTNYAGVTENCQSLVALDGRAFRMNDVPCWITTGRSFYFLCEVPC